MSCVLEGFPFWLVRTWTALGPVLPLEIILFTPFWWFFSPSQHAKISSQQKTLKNQYSDNKCPFSLALCSKLWTLSFQDEKDDHRLCLGFSHHLVAWKLSQGSEQGPLWFTSLVLISQDQCLELMFDWCFPAFYIFCSIF